MTMLRQASSRNQRSKGFKVKHALQICLLVAICIWLLYQVKHSHEKKKAFEERSSKILNKVLENQAGFFRFGRKDLPHIEETGSVTEIHHKEEESDETQEEEEEHDSKQEEIEVEEGRGAGDDEIDEQDQERGDEEGENGEESTEEEDKDSHDEDKDGHDEVDVFDNQEHEGGTQEAREENYKRDDASSAVVHDTHATESENTGGGGNAEDEQGNTDEEQVVDNVDDESSAKGGDDANTDASRSEVVGENSEKKVVESENVANGSHDGSRGDNDAGAGSGGVFVGNVSDIVINYNETTQTDHLSSNTTATDNKNMEVDNKDVAVEFSKPDNGSVSNSTTVEYNSQMEQETNLTAEAVTNTHMELQTNLTGGVPDQQTETHDNSAMVDAAGFSTSTDTVNLDSAQTQNAAADNATVGDEHDSQFVVDPAGKLNTTTVLESEEHSTTAVNENGNAAHGESDNSLHASVITEGKDARTDLSTLPEIQNEVKTTDDEAAE